MEDPIEDPIEMPPMESIARARDPATEGRPVLILACVAGLMIAALMVAIDLTMSPHTMSLLAPWPSRRGLFNPLSYHILAVEEAVSSRYHRQHNSGLVPTITPAPAEDPSSFNSSHPAKPQVAAYESPASPALTTSPHPTTSPTPSPSPAPTSEPSMQPTSPPSPSPPTSAPSNPPTNKPTLPPPVPTSAPSPRPSAAPPAEEVAKVSSFSTTTTTAAACPDALARLSHSCLQRAEAAQGSKVAWEGGVVDVRINGEMANQIFDVVFGIIVADVMGYKPRIPNIMHSDDAEAVAQVSTDGCTEWTSVDQMQAGVCDSLVAAFSKADVAGHCVLIHDGYWQRYAMYQPYKERIKHLMHVPQWDDGPRPADPGPNDVVIHIRWWPSNPDPPLQTLEGIRADLFYPALTWEYYDNVLKRMKPWDRIWLVCMPEISQSPLVKKLQETYGAQLQSGDRDDDFNFLKRATRLVLGASTFSWWAAFLSHAWEVHYPLAGFLHPSAQMPDFESDVPGELTIYDEERYIYHDLLQRKWWGRFDRCTNNFIYQYEEEPTPSG